MAQHRLDVVEFPNHDGTGLWYSFRRPAPLVVRLHTSSLEAGQINGNIGSWAVRWDVRRERHGSSSLERTGRTAPVAEHMHSTLKTSLLGRFAAGSRSPAGCRTRKWLAGYRPPTSSSPPHSTSRSGSFSWRRCGGEPRSLARLPAASRRSLKTASPAYLCLRVSRAS